MSDNNFNEIMNRVSLIKIYGSIWNDEESGITAFAQQIWDYERKCWVSDYPDLFGGGDPAEFPDIPLIDKTLTQHDQAADAYEVGIRLGNLTNIINNLPVPTEDRYRGNITLANLLLLESPDDGLAYNVFLSGNETDGYSTENFMFDGVSHPAGSRAIYVSDHWVIKDIDEDKTYKVMAFEALQEKLVLPKNILSGYAHTYSASVSGASAGIHLFDAYVYNLTPEGYEREYTTFGTPSGQRMTDLWTVSVPYAKRHTYEQGGVVHTEYREGALSEELCRYLYEHSHDWNEIENKPEFGAVAFSNDYNDLINKPEALNLHSVAYSGDYDELNNKPAIPAAQVPADWNASSGPSRILNKPNIPENVVRYVQQNLTQEQQAQARQNIGAGTSNFSGNYNDLTNKPVFASVATSGSYNDLTDKPTIPDISNYVTLDTSQTITGSKRFKNSDWGQISLWADGSKREYPCINYYSVQTQSTEFVGSIGVVRTGYLAGYPAYWAQQQGTPQKLIRDVDVDPILQSGTKIAEIGGKDIYAPSGGGQSQAPNNGRLRIKLNNGSPLYEFYADDSNNVDANLSVVESASLNGETIQKVNGNVDIKAMPLLRFGYNKGSSETGTHNYWREELRCTLSTKTWNQSMTQVFVVRDVLGYEWQKAGLLYVSYILNTTGTYTYISLATDNPILLGSFALVADESRGRISIYSKQGSYGKNGWQYLSISYPNYFEAVDTPEVESLPTPSASIKVSYVDCYTKPSEYRKFIEIDWQNGSYNIVRSSEELQLYVVSGTYPDDAHFHLLLRDGENILSRYNDFVSRHRLLLSYTYELNGVKKKYDERLLTAPTGVGIRQTGENEYEYYIDITLNGSMVKSSASIKIMFEEI